MQFLQRKETELHIALLKFNLKIVDTQSWKHCGIVREGARFRANQPLREGCFDGSEDVVQSRALADRPREAFRSLGEIAALSTKAEANGSCCVEPKLEAERILRSSQQSLTGEGIELDGIPFTGVDFRV